MPVSINRRTLLAGLAACTTAAVASPVHAREPAQSAAADNAAPGHVLATIRDGAIETLEARGYGSLEHARPLDARSVFHIASLSKQFTATAIALLEGDGKLTLDDPLARWIPEAKHFGEALTLAHLVYFTSGLPEYTTRPAPSGGSWFAFHYFDFNAQVAAVLAAPKLDFAPGSRWRYTNSDYALLARVAERAADRPLAEILRERVFDPLGMRDTFLHVDPTRVVAHRVDGYAERSAAIVAELRKAGIPAADGAGWVRLYRHATHYGGSGVMSTVADMARWEGEWAKPLVLGRTLQDRLLRTRRFAHDKSNDAMGIVLDEIEGHRIAWFAGSDIDVSSHVVRFRDAGISVLCLSNRVPDGPASRLAREHAQRLVETKVVRE